MSFYVVNCTKCKGTMQAYSKSVVDPAVSLEVLDRQTELCRGQGPCYAKLPHGRPAFFTSYLFIGVFEGSCCLCAVKAGWSPLSFEEDGCTRCKTRIEKRKTFAKVLGSKGIWKGLDANLVKCIIGFV